MYDTHKQTAEVPTLAVIGQSVDGKSYSPIVGASNKDDPDFQSSSSEVEDKMPSLNDAKAATTALCICSRVNRSVC